MLGATVPASLLQEPISVSIVCLRWSLNKPDSAASEMACQMWHKKLICGTPAGTKELPTLLPSVLAIFEKEEGNVAEEKVETGMMG